MAEKALVAFGRYLKLLRERRGLSLDDVATLTKAYPEPVNKGYLSRAERGLSHIAFSKIVALGRAYEIPIDVFGEKLSLDLEVDQLRDAPETEGKGYEELLQEAGRLNKLGLRLQAYAVLRDSLSRASSDPVAKLHASRAEQIAAAGLSLGILAGGSGRLQLATLEIECALATGALSPDPVVTASIQLTNIHRRTRDFQRARTFAIRALEDAQASPTRRFLADALAANGLLADAEERFDEAIEFHKRAYALFRGANRDAEAARAMANLANAYFNAERFGAARRALEVAFRIATASGNEGTRSRSKILLGEIEALQGRRSKAVSLWHDALDIAKKAHDRVAAFKAEFQLFKSALDEGHATAANAFGRRLNRLWPWIPLGEVEVGQFRELWSRHRPKRKRGFARAQPPPSH
jgi:tetratricopeptide (TPR) repeat protein